MVKVLWDEIARDELRAAYDYIKLRSPQNAEGVRKEIITFAIKVAKNPESHSIDKYRLNNDGTFRYFELHKYRITYRVLKDEILIIRVRHTKQLPVYH